MPERKVILVTGVSQYWGREVASRLIEAAGQRFEDSPWGPDEMHIIGLDSEPAQKEIKGLDFIQADIRNPMLVELLRSEEVDTVCHLTFLESAQPSETAFDLNVIGTMKVLGACAEAGVRKVVLMSSTEVYGALPSNSAYLTEQHPLHGSRTWGPVRDRVEIEAFCNGFIRQVPEMLLSILRFSSIVGTTAETPMTRFLREPRAPILLGFDPLMQVIHERDVIEALVYTVLNDIPGVFNVAAEGVLPLTRLMRLAGKIPLPLVHLFAYWGTNLLKGAGLSVGQFVPIDLDYLRYSWVADLQRMREELGFTPRYTADEALREFAGQQRLSRYLPESAALAYDEERLRDTIERRRRVREHQVVKPVETLKEGENERR